MTLSGLLYYTAHILKQHIPDFQPVLEAKLYSFPNPASTLKFAQMFIYTLKCELEAHAFRFILE